MTLETLISILKWLGPFLLTALGAWGGIYYQKRKAKAEVSGMEADVESKTIENKFEATKGYKNISEESLEFAEELNVKFLQVKRELNSLKVKYYEEISDLTIQLDRKSKELAKQKLEIDYVQDRLEQREAALKSYNSLLKKKMTAIKTLELGCEEKVRELESILETYIDDISKLKNGSSNEE